MGDPLAIEARLLGALDLRVAGRPLPPLDSARAESLLAYLLLHRAAPQPRQRLAFALWPDSTEAQAQTNLRKVLHNLRRALPEAELLIDIRARTLQWRADAPAWLDVDHFERAVACDDLDEALATYAGELLEGRYDEWLLEERARLAQLHLDVLERAARRHGDQRRHVEAIRCAERLVAGDPLREESHRLLIELCQAAGDRARAARAYHGCAATLDRELGIQPAPETQALYASLVGAPADPSSTGAGPAFVGRDRERARLTTAWRDAVSGRAQLVLVTGEAGIGKTRLVEQLRAAAASPTVETRAYAAEGALAYGIVAAWLRTPAVTARLNRLDRAHLTELSRLLPELSDQAPPPEPLPEAELRRRLFAAAARAVVGAGAPLLVILDDAQWADAQSLRFIHYLLRVAPTAPLLIALTARREELDTQHPLTELITALRAQERVGDIALDRLDAQETARLATSIAERPLQAADLDRLYRASEGNPLFVVEALRPDAPVAGKVQAVIAGRLARLSPRAAELAGLAAVIGRAFTADALAAAASLDEHDLVVALDELWRRGIVRAHGPNTYDFSHGRIRDAAYDQLTPPEQRRAHLAVARALEHRGGAPAASLAVHYEKAGLIAEAVRWHARAAEQAQWLQAHAGAVAALERALALSDALPPGPDTARLQLRLLTALPAPLLTREGYGSDHIDGIHKRALLLAEQLATEPEPPLVWSLAMAALTRGDWSAARGFGERLRARAERSDDQVLWVESDYLQGVAAYWPGRLELAREHFEAAMRRFTPARRRAHVLRYGQDPELLVRLRLAHTAWLLGDDASADEQRDRALAAAAEASHAYSRMTTEVWAGILALERGDIARLRRHADNLRAVPDDEAPEQVTLPAKVFTAYLDVLDGRSAGGLARLREVRNVAVQGRSPAPGVPGVATRVLLDAYARGDEPERGLALADQALTMGRGAELWEAEIRRLRAVFLVALGHPDEEVEAELARALEVAGRQRAAALEARIRGTLAERPVIHHRAL